MQIPSDNINLKLTPTPKPTPVSELDSSTTMWYMPRE